jgi:hypothetical protein
VSALTGGTATIRAVAGMLSGPILDRGRPGLLAHVRLYKAFGGGWRLADAEWRGPARRAQRSLMRER